MRATLRLGLAVLVVSSGAAGASAEPGPATPDPRFDVLGAPRVHGVDLLRHPTAVPPAGWMVHAGVVQPWLGSGLQEHTASWTRTSARMAWAIGAAMQQSDVHHRLQVSVAMQWRTRHHVLGTSVTARQWSFGNGMTVWRGQLRCAWSVRLQRAARVVLVCDPPLRPAAPPRAVLFVGTSLFAPLHLVLREERVAGLAVRRQWGVTWTNRAWSLGLGVDTGTLNVSLGVSLAASAWIWGTTASLHPHLGWSRATGLSYGR